MLNQKISNLHHRFPLSFRIASSQQQCFSQRTMSISVTFLCSPRVHSSHPANISKCPVGLVGEASTNVALSCSLQKVASFLPSIRRSSRSFLIAISFHTKTVQLLEYMHVVKSYAYYKKYISKSAYYAGSTSH